MKDVQKVIDGLERCLKHTCPQVDSKEYYECEYTIGIYCGQDKLLRDAVETLKEQEDKLRVMFNRCEALTSADMCDICALREKCEKLLKAVKV